MTSLVHFSRVTCAAPLSALTGLSLLTRILTEARRRPQPAATRDTSTITNSNALDFELSEEPEPALLEYM